MLTVADIMTSNPATAGRSAPLGEILGLMKARNCRQIPIVEEGRVIGIVSDRDIRLAMNSSFVLHERSQDQALLTQITAEACMTHNPMTIEAGEAAVKAAELLLTYKFGGLPVVQQNQLVGIVTISDILRSYIDLMRERESG